MFDNAKVRRISETTKQFQLNNVNRNVKNMIEPSRGSAAKYYLNQVSNLTEIMIRSSQVLISCHELVRIDPKEKADYSSRAIGFRNYVINTNHSSVFSVSAI